MKRKGFTLVEVLIVVVIIGILASLLVPALGKSVVKAKETAVVMEIKQLETAILAFQSSFGVDIPSRLSLYEDPNKWQSDPLSMSIVRSMFPQFDFNKPRDINANNVPNETLELTSGECLTFFLAGMRRGLKPVGFSKNPSDPFLTPLVSSVESRVGPFMEFDIGRMVDLDDDGIFEYMDNLPGQVIPYAYYNANNGSGYDPKDLSNGMISVYTLPKNMGAYRSNSFQIISPGYDGVLGLGGSYDPNDPIKSLAVGRPTKPQKPSTYGFEGIVEQDNLTNFSMGRLGH